MNFLMHHKWTYVDPTDASKILHETLSCPLGELDKKTNEDILLISDYFMDRQISNSVSPSIMIRNCQGAASRLSLNTLAELIRRYDPPNLVLVETKIWMLYRINAQGFQGEFASSGKQILLTCN